MVFLRYLWVNPTSSSCSPLRRAATSAFLAECVLLAPAAAPLYLLEPGSSPMPQALGLSFALSLIFFCLFHTWLEWKGKQGLRMSLRTKIRELRLRDRLSQEELAQRVGVRRETIGHLENGHYNPSLKLAMDIAHVFGCTVEDIFFFED